MPHSNGTMMQAFHWYLPSDGEHWNNLAEQAAALADSGFTALWLPPACKAEKGAADVGYGIYDLYDLGEFDQKGTTRTKYGTKQQLRSAIDACHNVGMQVYCDVVFNHKGGADETEWAEAVRVKRSNRNVEVEDARSVQAWTRFTFPGRGGEHSAFVWNHEHFDGVDWDEHAQEKAIFRFVGPGRNWEQKVSQEKGNFDYLMHADVDFNHPDVRAEFTRWADWFLSETGVDGFRVDAVKHIQNDFFAHWLGDLRSRHGRELFAVAEYWHATNVELLHGYIEASRGCMSLFDAPLHGNFYKASRSGGQYDMRRILDGTLMNDQPALAVTLVDNHDTQPGQALESWVDWWFKPLAYALILLRQEGYPCVFHADWYGATYTTERPSEQAVSLVEVPGLRELLRIRCDLAYGEQRDYFHEPWMIGWTREGDDDHPNSGLAVLMSIGGEGKQWMHVGSRHAGANFHDALGNQQGKVMISQDGWGEFCCSGGSVSVWVRSTAGD